jgi:hypothetical protein
MLREVLSELEWWHKEYGAPNGTAAIEALRAHVSGVPEVQAPSIGTENILRELDRLADSYVPTLTKEVATAASAWIRAALAAGVKVCRTCSGTGKQAGEPCGRCEGTGHDKHDPWCVGGERDGICNCGAHGVGVPHGGKDGN